MILTYDNINPMQIQWLGQSCFKIQAKNNGQEITIVTDPYGDDIGLRPLKLQADIVTVSHDHHDHNNLDAIKGDSFIVHMPGEYETRGVFIYGIPAFHDNKEGQEKYFELSDKFCWCILRDAFKQFNSNIKIKCKKCGK